MDLVIRAVADQHGILPEIEPCDILLIAGDVCPVHDHDEHFQQLWLRTNFRDWLKRVPAKHIVGIGGNHDFVLESVPSLGDLLPWTYLCDSGTEVEGLKVYGYPWVPNLPGWAFHKDAEGLKEVAEAIPSDIDILVTHGPPQGFGDRVRQMRLDEISAHVGDSHLLHELDRVNAKLHVYGHIHEDRGEWIHHRERLANVALVDEHYQRGKRDPVEFPLPHPESS